MVSHGQVIVHTLQSTILEDNPLKDPSTRKLHVYLPPDYSPHDKVPALLAIVGFTGTGGMLFNVTPLGEDLQTRMDRLIQSDQCGKVIIVAPDCFTKLGGNQYINSTAIGNYEDYLLKEVIPFVESNYPVSNWGVFGKSSGGYGSMVLGMRNPDTFLALADHSGDSNFELSYIPDMGKALNLYREKGGPKKWLEEYWKNPTDRHGKNIDALNMLAMAATYSPNPKSPHLGIDFPFDFETGVFVPEVWERWQKWDPVRMIPHHVSNLKKLRLIYIDCGNKDEFNLHWGARAKVLALKKAGIPCVYEEFNDGHMNIGYRYDVSIPKIVRVLNQNN